jgi:hypothetical protein
MSSGAIAVMGPGTPALCAGTGRQPNRIIPRGGTRHRVDVTDLRPDAREVRREEYGARDRTPATGSGVKLARRTVWRCTFMLAARAGGMGRAWTAIHRFERRDAAEGLDIAHQELTHAAAILVAFTIGDAFTPGARLPMATCVRWNSRDGVVAN